MVNKLENRFLLDENIENKTTYIFKKKCKVHPTWIKAAAGGKMIAKIVKRLENKRFP